MGGGFRLCQQGHAEGTKVGPEQEVQGVECESAPAGMTQVILPAKLPFWSQLNSTVIEEAIRGDLAVVLQGRKMVARLNDFLVNGDYQMAGN